jgi:peptidoglycan hydrolase CwlO-like protein
MKLIKKKNRQNIVLSLGLCLLLVSGVVILASCGGKESETAEEQVQEVPEPQEKVVELQKELAGKEQMIEKLNEEKADLQAQIPQAYEVQKGDSHWQIAFDYLTQQQGLLPEEAAGKLADNLLYHPILMGFKVWNYFYDGVYGSFITQGTATVSPGAIMRLKKKEAKEEKVGLESEIENLKNQKQELAKQIDQIQTEHAAEKNRLNDRIASIEQNLNKAQTQNQNLEEKLNSVYYLAGSKDSLQDNGKIKGTFLGICGTRVKDITFADFQNRIDLREKDNIELKASDFDLSRINKVKLLPKHLEEGTDYRVEIAGDRRSARVILLNKEKFRLARLVIFMK